jgi:hypothetical protein
MHTHAHLLRTAAALKVLYLAVRELITLKAHDVNHVAAPRRKADAGRNASMRRGT